MAAFRKILVIYCRCLEQLCYRKQVENSLIVNFQLVSYTTGVPDTYSI